MEMKYVINLSISPGIDAVERKAVKKEGACGTYIGVWTPPRISFQRFCLGRHSPPSLYISKWGHCKVHVLGQVSCAFTNSIEFNQGSNLFAVCGVTQKINFYDYYSVIGHNAAFPFPSLVVECRSILRSVVTIISSLVSLGIYFICVLHHNSVVSVCM